MRTKSLRIGIAVLAVAATAALGPSGVASGKAPPTTHPRIILERDCETFKDEGASSVTIRLMGFPPFTPFEATLELSDGTGVGPIRDTTDANGNWEPFGQIGSFTPVTWTVTVVWSGGTLTRSLYVDCSTPASKSDCKKGGWRDFGFKNQGQCIAFVKHGPR